VPETLFADDHVPDTLMALLRFVAEDYLPEIRAYVQFANDGSRRGLDSFTWRARTALLEPRIVGMTTLTWRGHPCRLLSCLSS